MLMACSGSDVRVHCSSVLSSLDCRFTDEYCLLNLSAIFFAVEMYLPLNRIASFSLVLFPLLRCFRSLKSFVVSAFLSSMVSLHLSLLCLFIVDSISLFRSLILGDSGSSCLSSSLSFIFSAASVGTSGMLAFILPAGIVLFAVVFQRA